MAVFCLMTLIGAILVAFIASAHHYLSFPFNAYPFKESFNSVKIFLIYITTVQLLSEQIQLITRILVWKCVVEICKQLI